jgi:hypothetical protein
MPDLGGETMPPLKVRPVVGRTPKEEPMNVRTVALQLIMAGLLASSLLWSTAAAVEPEKQPIYVNIEGTAPPFSLCGTNNGVCTVPPGQRLIIEYVSGYTFIRETDQTATEVSLLVNDPQLHLNGGNAFHTFVAIRGSSTSGPNGVDTTFTFSTPFRMMLHPGATFQFTAVAVAVSGYLVKD